MAEEVGLLARFHYNQSISMNPKYIDFNGISGVFSRQPHLRTCMVYMRGIR